MSTKLSFRARTLDPSKPMPIYFADELPDIQEYSAINRAVPQMPSGMEKEEESVRSEATFQNLEIMLMADSIFHPKIFKAFFCILMQFATDLRSF